MKKFLALALICALALSACSSQPTGGPESQGSAPAEEKVIKIGVFEPATGDSGAGGKQETLGMQYANSVTPTVEIGGETYKVELVYADNGSSTDKATSAAAELVSKGVSVVLGSYGSSVSIAAGPTFDEAGLAAIGVTCTNPGVTAGNDYYFRICFLDPFQGTVLAHFAMDTFGAQTAYCLGELGNEYDQGLVEYFKQAFEAAGGRVITDSFPTNNSDFTSYLSKAKNEGADVFFSPVSIAYSTQIVDQAASMGVDFPILGGDTLDNNRVLAAATGKNIKLFVSTFYQEGSEDTKDFDEGIKAWLESNPQAKTDNGGDTTIAAVTAMGFDAYYVALEAIKAADSADPGAIKAALPGVEYTGVSGRIVFDDIGDAIRDTAYIKTANTETGAWDFVTQQGVG
jgi:branched-chain amino acid transport system substrate-binding protein